VLFWLEHEHFFLSLAGLGLLLGISLTAIDSVALFLEHNWVVVITTIVISTGIKFLLNIKRKSLSSPAKKEIKAIINDSVKYPIYFSKRVIF
jgi:hypothetical protein